MPFLGLVLIVLIIAVLGIFQPSIDTTADGKILLWYGNGYYGRKYIILWPRKPKMKKL